MWLTTNKILLNADKTELVLFRSRKKKSLKTRTSEQLDQKYAKQEMLCKTKYLGPFLDEKSRLPTV